MAGQATDTADHEKGRYTPLIRDPEGIYDKPLPCFGCGIGWFSWVFFFHPPSPNLFFLISWLYLLLQFSLRIHVSTDVVLCYIPVFWKLLPQGSQRTSRPCCFSNCCEFSFLSLSVLYYQFTINHHISNTHIQVIVVAGNGVFRSVVGHCGFSTIMVRVLIQIAVLTTLYMSMKKREFNSKELHAYEE